MLATASVLMLLACTSADSHPQLSDSTQVGYRVLHLCDGCELSATVPIALGPPELDGMISSSRLIAASGAPKLRLAWAPTDTRGVIGQYDHATRRTVQLGQLGSGPGEMLDLAAIAYWGNDRIVGIEGSQLVLVDDSGKAMKRFPLPPMVGTVWLDVNRNGRAVVVNHRGRGPRFGLIDLVGGTSRSIEIPDDPAGRSVFRAVSISDDLELVTARLNMQWEVEFRDSTGVLVLTIPQPDWFVPVADEGFDRAVAARQLSSLRHASSVTGVRWLDDGLAVVSVRIADQTGVGVDTSDPYDGRLEFLSPDSGAPLASLQFNSPVQVISRDGWVAAIVTDSSGFPHASLRRIELKRP